MLPLLYQLAFTQVVVLFPHLCDVSTLQDVDEKLWLGAESNVKLHLVKLLEEGKVNRREGDDGDSLWSLTLEHKL